MTRYKRPEIHAGGVTVSQSMANTLLELRRGMKPYWPNATLRALHKRRLIYPEPDQGGRFLLSELGEEVAEDLEKRYGKRI